MCLLFTWLMIKWKSCSKVCWIFQQLLQQNRMAKFNMFFHGCCAIIFMVCNEALLTSCAHGQYFKKSCFIVANNASHNWFLERLIG